VDIVPGLGGARTGTGLVQGRRRSGRSVAGAARYGPGPEAEPGVPAVAGMQGRQGYRGMSRRRRGPVEWYFGGVVNVGLGGSARAIRG
jgi:hypothetical protein